MVQKPDGSLRLPSLLERERGIGFPQGYISNALSPKLTIQEAHNVGCCMIGNSFNVFSITLLLDELLWHFDPAYVPRCLDRIFVTDERAPHPPGGVACLSLIPPASRMMPPACWFKNFCGRLTVGELT